MTIMNVQNLKLMACNKEALVIRINVCFSKTKSALFFNCTMGNLEATLCSSDDCSGSKVSARNFSRLFFYKGIKLS